MKSLKMMIVATLALSTISCGSKKTTQNIEEEKVTHELTAFDVQKEFAHNDFTWFTENLILCSGNINESNAMTIGWGGIGNYLGHSRPAVTVYVAPSRYTW